jgi:hypothetical protein
MLVGVASLADGQLLPIGQDAAGKPVYAALSDAAGRYTLYLPKGLEGNVRVVALAPGANDPRLQYGLVFAPAQGAEAQELGEATALASAFLRIQMTRFLELYLATPADQLAARFKKSQVPDALVPALTGIFGDMQAAATKARYAERSPAERRRGLQRCADAVLAISKLDAFRVNNKLADWHGPDEPALAAMATLIAQMNARTAAILKDDPHHFEQKPFMVSANRQRQAAGLVPLAIARPDDLAVLALGEYFAGTDPAELRKLEEVLTDIGLPSTERQHLSAAASGIYQGMLGSLLGDDETRNRLIDKLSTVFDDLPPAKPVVPGVPGAKVSPAPTPEPAVSVSTLAGNGKDGGKDGPALAASLPDPRALALQEGPTGVTLYVSDHYAIRRLTQGADGGFTLDTIAGSGSPGFKDGPGANALFRAPVGLALDGKGGLYVADADNNRIRRVALDDPAFPVTTVAGTGGTGQGNGPGAQATFEAPVGVAYQAGKLYVINQVHPRLRQIDLEAPGFPVTSVNQGGEGDVGGPLAISSFDNTISVATTRRGQILLGTGNRIWEILDGFQRTLVGTSYGGGRDGFWMDARMGYVYAMADDAAGNVFGVDADNGRVFRVWPSGDLQTLAGPMGLGADNGFPAPGYVDGPGASARFDHPEGLAVDGKGRLYVADRNNRRIRLITRSGN